MEALLSNTYESEAVALTQVRVCRLPVEVIERLNRETPRLHMGLMGKWHRSLKEADDGWPTSTLGIRASGWRGC